MYLDSILHDIASLPKEASRSSPSYMAAWKPVADQISALMQHIELAWLTTTNKFIQGDNFLPLVIAMLLPYKAHLLQKVQNKLELAADIDYGKVGYMAMTLSSAIQYILSNKLQENLLPNLAEEKIKKICLLAELFAQFHRIPTTCANYKDYLVIKIARYLKQHAKAYYQLYFTQIDSQGARETSVKNIIADRQQNSIHSDELNTLLDKYEVINDLLSIISNHEISLQQQVKEFITKSEKTLEKLTKNNDAHEKLCLHSLKELLSINARLHIISEEIFEGTLYVHTASLFSSHQDTPASADTEIYTAPLKVFSSSR